MRKGSPSKRYPPNFTRKQHLNPYSHVLSRTTIIAHLHCTERLIKTGIEGNDKWVSWARVCRFSLLGMCGL